MGIATSFRDLNVYQLSRNAAYSIYVMTKAFPPHERYSLTDQIRWSSRAVNAMVAAAWARRRYRAAFISKLSEALEESAETQAWLDHAVDCSYITDEQFREADAQWQSTGAMISGMMNKADDFCKFPSDKSYTRR
jgi:four helix bundle protein